NENRTDTQAAATGEIDPRIAFSIVAEHDFAGADGFSGDASVGLQAHTEIRRGAPGACTADNLVAGLQGDSSSRGTGKVLRSLSDRTDCRLQVEFSGVNLGFVRQGYGAKS